MTANREQIADLRKLHEAATPGPWTNDDCTTLWCETKYATPALYGAKRNGCSPLANFDDGEYVCSPNPKEDAALVAAMRNALPDLLDTIEQLTRERDEARVCLESIRFEAERENGGWVHLKRCIAVQARTILSQQDKG